MISQRSARTVLVWPLISTAMGFLLQASFLEARVQELQGSPESR